MIQDLYYSLSDYAAHCHRNQQMPHAPISYMVHVDNVAMEVMEAHHAMNNFDIDYALKVAFLHDVLEDTDTTYQTLREDYGQQVADGVLALSRNPELPRNEQINDCLERILRQPYEVWVVKMADRIVNLHNRPGYRTREQTDEYKVESVKILETLSVANHYLANRLSRMIGKCKA